MKNAVRDKQVLLHTILISCVALTFVPFVFIIVTSFKSNDQFMHNFWGLSSTIELGNYVTAGGAIAPYILNSLSVTVFSVIGVLIVSSLTAYAFARYKFPGSQPLYYAVLAFMMIPGVLTLISSFMWVKEFPFLGGNNYLGIGGQGMINSHIALILPYISGGQVFAIIVLRSFFASLPESMFEAAKIDGASDMKIFLSLAVPLSKPALSTMAIITMLNVWNDFIWPSIVLSDNARKTITAGLVAFQGTHNTNYGPLMAGYVLASIPLLILFFVFMKYFVEGLTAGSAKG